MSDPRIPKSVEAYKDECAAVMSWLSTDTWLEQDEFDRLSREWRRRPGPRNVYSFTPETLVAPMNGDLNLVILQAFQRAGLVIAHKRKGGKISYRLAPPPGGNVFSSIKADARPKRGMWAPGSYLSKCIDCGFMFIGDKRALSCACCAYSKPEPVRACTCHPDDKPPVPCPEKYALRECRAAAIGWQPAHTAPQDGTRILAFGDIGLQGEEVVAIVRWSNGHWDANDDPEQGPWECRFTHWMPLPARP